MMYIVLPLFGFGIFFPETELGYTEWDIYTNVITSRLSSLFNFSIKYLNVSISISYCSYTALLFWSLLCFHLQRSCMIKNVLYVLVITRDPTVGEVMQDRVRHRLLSALQSPTVSLPSSSSSSSDDMHQTYRPVL